MADIKVRLKVDSKPLKKGLKQSSDAQKKYIEKTKKANKELKQKLSQVVKEQKKYARAVKAAERQIKKHTKSQDSLSTRNY